MRKVYEGLYSEQGTDGKYALFSVKGKSKERISDWKYDKVWKTTGGIYGVVNNQFYVLIDGKTGSELTPDNEFTFIGDSYFGARLCKNADKKCGIMVNNKVVSPWVDSIRIEKGFCVVGLNGLYYMTTGNCCKKIAGPFKKIGEFSKGSEFIASFADVVGINGKVGTVDSNGGIGIPCEYEYLYSFGEFFKIYHYRSGSGKDWYGLIAVNGELVTKESYDSFKIAYGNVELVSPDGEVVIYNTLGHKVKSKQ